MSMIIFIFMYALGNKESKTDNKNDQIEFLQHHTFSPLSFFAYLCIVLARRLHQHQR